MFACTVRHSIKTNRTVIEYLTNRYLPLQNAPDYNKKLMARPKESTHSPDLLSRTGETPRTSIGGPCEKDSGRG